MSARVMVAAFLVALVLVLTAPTPLESAGCYWNCYTRMWGAHCESEYPVDGQTGSQCTNTLSCIWCVDQPPEVCCEHVCDLQVCLIV